MKTNQELREEAIELAIKLVDAVWVDDTDQAAKLTGSSTVGLASAMLASALVGVITGSSEARGLDPREQWDNLTSSLRTIIREIAE